MDPLFPADLEKDVNVCLAEQFAKSPTTRELEEVLNNHVRGICATYLVKELRLFIAEYGPARHTTERICEFWHSSDVENTIACALFNDTILQQLLTNATQKDVVLDAYAKNVARETFDAYRQRMITRIQTQTREE